MRSSAVSFHYDEEQTVLQIDYDREKNQVVIRGSRDALALLARLCVLFAEIPATSKKPMYEDEHWRHLMNNTYDFTLIVNNALPFTSEE